MSGRVAMHGWGGVDIGGTLSVDMRPCGCFIFSCKIRQCDHMQVSGRVALHGWGVRPCGCFIFVVKLDSVTECHVYGYEKRIDLWRISPVSRPQVLTNIASIVISRELMLYRILFDKGFLQGIEVSYQFSHLPLLIIRGKNGLTIDGRRFNLQC